MITKRDQHSDILIFEGALEIWSSEGGHAFPNVSVDKTDVASEIEEFAQNLPREYGQDDGTRCGEIGQLQGKWRITLERVG